jgi:hypothetical protein
MTSDQNRRPVYISETNRYRQYLGIAIIHVYLHIMPNTGCDARKLICNFVFIQMNLSTSKNETSQRPPPLSTGEERG